MLYTRCPQCDTTFRITEGALNQARGQVRCGRCAHIFDARESLTDSLAEADADSPEAAGDAMRSVAKTTADEAAATAATPEVTTESMTGGTPDRPAGTLTQRSVEGSAAYGGAPPKQSATTQGVDRRQDAGDAPEAVAPAEPDLMSADEIDAVLETPPPGNGPEWIAEDSQPRRSGLWSAAAGIALIVLAAQVIDYYRGDLARNASFGPLLLQVYALIGRPVTPNWDLERYELIDWVAIEDAGASGQRNLVIRSRLRNSGEREQPYPLVHLRLLDRRETAVSARLFTPDEYAASATSGTEMMQAGEIVNTELVIVDPGADTYGFELAVCLEGAAGIVCDTDATFR